MGGPVPAGTRALLVAAGGLVLAGSVLLCSLPGAAAPRGGPAAPAAPAAQADGRLRPLAAREVCEDGRDPAESWRASREAGEAVRRIQDRGRLIVGVDQNSYLWGYRVPDTGQIVGFDIDLVRAIAEDLLGSDPQIVFKAVPTDQRIPLLQSGQVDMVVRTMSITCKRWEDVAFSTAYFEAGQQLLVPRAGTRISGFDASLSGTKVCAATGSTAQELLESKEAEALGPELIYRDNHLDCLVLMQLGEADALMTDSALAAGHAAQDPSMHLIGEPLTEEPYGVAMNREDEDLVRRVNSVLEDFRGGDAGTSAWRQSYEEWLAGYLPEDAGPEPPQPLYRD